MKASNIFKIFVRTLMVVFFVAFIISLSNASSNKEDFKEKINSLHIGNNGNKLTWLDWDSKKASLHFKTSLQNLKESKAEQFKSEIRIAKLLLAFIEFSLRI